MKMKLEISFTSPSGAAAVMPLADVRSELIFIYISIEPGNLCTDIAKLCHEANLSLQGSSANLTGTGMLLKSTNQWWRLTDLNREQIPCAGHPGWISCTSRFGYWLRLVQVLILWSRSDITRFQRSRDRSGEDRSLLRCDQRPHEEILGHWTSFRSGESRFARRNS